MQRICVRRRGLQLVIRAAFLFLLVLAGSRASAQRIPLDGVAHATRHFELVKRVAAAQRSVINPNAPYDERARARRRLEAQSGLEQLGASLGHFFIELRSEKSAYPMLRDVILDYDYVQPKDQSVENGRLYTMYIGELYWPFPAPLLADLLRVRVVHPLPQPLRDLLTVALRRWGRDNIDRARGESEAEELRRIAALISELESPKVAAVRWKRDSTVNQLVRSYLGPRSLARLRAAVRSESDSVRSAALEVLGRGGWIDEPEFFAELLEDRDIRIRRAAFWGLVFMRANRGISSLRSYIGRVDAIAARLREARAAPTAEQIATEVEGFDKAIGAEPLPKPVLDMLPTAAPAAPILGAAQDAVPDPVGPGMPEIVPMAVLPADDVAADGAADDADGVDGDDAEDATEDDAQKSPASKGEPAESVTDDFPP